MSTSLPQIETNSVEIGRDEAGGAAPDSPRDKISWTDLARALFFCCARLAFAAFLMVTSLYCLLVWVPFSYFGFIRNPLMSWIPVFVRWHALIFGSLLVGVAITLIPELRRKQTRRAALGFLVINAGCFIYIWWRHSLANLEIDITSYTWSMFSLLPLAWLAALDLYGINLSGLDVSGRDSPGLDSSGNENPLATLKPHRLNLAQTTLASFAVTTVFAVASRMRGTLQSGSASGASHLDGFLASLCFHLTIFTVVGFVLMLIRRASAATPWAGVLNFVLPRMFAWFLCMQALRTMILPTISFDGTQATIFAAVVSLLAILFATGFAVKLRAMLPAREISVTRTGIPRWLRGVLTLLVLAVAAYGIPVWLGPTDWDFVFQRVAVIAVWLVVLWMVGWTGIRMRGKALSIAVVLLLAGAGIGFARYARLALYTSDPEPGSQSLLDSYAGADISFKTAYDVLSHPVNNQDYRQFYEFLKANTNLGRDVVVAPADTRLVADLQPTAGIKPNVFLFVIDSLRQDYLSPYNPAVHYAPQIDRFAKDSIVLGNAFTRYGGTALSEPAIWVGAMQLHKQYIEPFAPMNNLQKLLDADGYQSYISMDPILKTILHPSPSITGLDEDTKAWSDLDFVATLKELETKLDARSDHAKPIFAYSQPQNVHTLTLARSRMPGGRKAVSIFELGRMDAAFGEFIAFLKQRGLYDNSIIILTADHGDSYGEYGRYGHSDFLFPEIIRIPLIVHLPPAMREQYVWDAKQPAFTTDITPSLYYLLGHKPIVNNDLFGRPLFTQSAEEASGYARSHYLIVSSYASVYAIVGGQGQSLFIVDAVNSKNYYYNLIDDPAGTRSHLSKPVLKENEALIRHDVGAIDEFYHWLPPQK